MVIFTDRRRNINLTTVALALRAEEIELMWEYRDVTIKPQFSPDELACRGEVKGWPPFTPYWFLHDVPRREANQLYQGTESAADVPPTRISLQTVIEIVTTILGEKFHPQFYKRCLKGWCGGQKCPWFNFELGRCEAAKFNTFDRRKK